MKGGQNPPAEREAWAFPSLVFRGCRGSCGAATFAPNICWWEFAPFFQRWGPGMINCAATVLRGAPTLPTVARTDAGRDGGA